MGRGEKNLNHLLYHMKRYLRNPGFHLIIVFSLICIKITIKNLRVPLKILLFSRHHTLGSTKIFVRELYRLQSVAQIQCVATSPARQGSCNSLEGEETVRQRWPLQCQPAQQESVLLLLLRCGRVPGTATWTRYPIALGLESSSSYAGTPFRIGDDEFKGQRKLKAVAVYLTQTRSARVSVIFLVVS